MSASAAVVLVSLFLIFVHDLFTQADYFAIRTIDVTGVRHLTAGEVIGKAKVATGDNLLGVNLILIRKRLQQHAWIEAVQVSRKIPDGLLINVTEYRPEAIVEIEDQRYLISNEGVLFKSAMDSDPKNLPLVTGISYTDIPVADLPASIQFEAVLEVLRMGRKTSSFLPIRQIRQIHMDRELGLTLDAFDPSLLIQIGYEHYPQKYQNLNRILDYLKKENAQIQVSAIDLRDLDEIVVTPAKSEDPHQG